MTNDSDAELLSTVDASRELGMSRTTVYWLVRVGAIRARVVGGRRVIARPDLEQYKSTHAAEQASTSHVSA